METFYEQDFRFSQPADVSKSAQSSRPSSFPCQPTFCVSSGLKVLRFEPRREFCKSVDVGLVRSKALNHSSLKALMLLCHHGRGTKTLRGARTGHIGPRPSHESCWFRPERVAWHSDLCPPSQILRGDRRSRLLRGGMMMGWLQRKLNLTRLARESDASAVFQA